jgi:hypothetical protein
MSFAKVAVEHAAIETGSEAQLDSNTAERQLRRVANGA